MACGALNPLSANFTKWSNTLKQFVGKFPTNCLIVFDNFVGLTLKGLKKSGKSTVNVLNYRSLCIEIFKTLIDINYNFIKDIFKLKMTNRPTQEKYKLNLEILESNQVRFGTKSLR